MVYLFCTFVYLLISKIDGHEYVWRINSKLRIIYFSETSKNVLVLEVQNKNFFYFMQNGLIKIDLGISLFFFRPPALYLK